jgi:hypothetical protein
LYRISSCINAIKNDKIDTTREEKLAGFVKHICRISIIAAVLPMVAYAAQQQNPRGNTSRNNVRNVESDASAAIRRSATSVIARSASVNSRNKHTVVTARPASVRTASVRSVRPVVNNVNVSRSATKSSLVRSGKKTVKGGPNVSRAGVARATAVFNDISKIGGGYAGCRDAYATCMDQFCANANDTYRRCYCSDRFQNFRDTADKIDTALQMLAEFQDNNLNAVDKTAAEVNAMYTASAGEKAIKRDTSASQKLLDSIGDVLSGKSSVQTNKQTLNSLGVLQLTDFTSSNDDIWGSSDSIFGGSSTTNMAELEGKSLYDSAAKQCAEITRESCGSDAMFNLARSAYSIMITQDCNAYEKNISAKKASVEETVRTAEKYLRDARLEEYRSHNSADVNECLNKVETALRQPTACGANYEKCMDYTGQYINAVTGEPIYSQALFGLNSLIVLDGTSDVLGANKQFDTWLEGKKMFATTALDSCRDLADTVWYEFKRSALIQIAQAQDEKIQQIKDSCVMTIKECYDSQTGALKEIDTSKMQSTDAIVAVTARGMCYDRVQACAALYGDPDGCAYDDKTKKLEAAKNSDGSLKKCGLQSLLTYVDTVDAVKVAEGCETALTKYAAEICPDSTPEGETEPIKYGSCFTKPKSVLRAAMDLRRKTFCAEDLVNSDNSNTLQEQNAFNVNIMEQIIKSIYDEMHIAFTAGCEDDPEVGGIWIDSDEMERPNPAVLAQKYYQKYYGKTITRAEQISEFNLLETGWCVAGGEKAQCEAMGQYAEGYDENNDMCTLTDQWYEQMCWALTGNIREIMQNGKKIKVWDGNKCIVDLGAAITEEESSATGTSGTEDSGNKSKGFAGFSSMRDYLTNTKNILEYNAAPVKENFGTEIKNSEITRQRI